MGVIGSILHERQAEKFRLNERYLNPQMVRVLRTIGFDRHYTEARGPHLYDADGHRYLDLLSGWGVFALGRNHPTVNDAIREVASNDLPNLVQMDVSTLGGVLAEELLATAPSERLEKVFFANSGAETVEGAVKMARYATRRERILHCDHAFHGLTTGALALNGEERFRQGFGPFMPGCEPVPFNDLEALEAALSRGDVAGFVVEPIQGKGVNLPADDYLAEAGRLCRKHGALLIADEVQTGLGRTGAMWALEHWGAEPDLLCCAKALSGGQVPVGAILCRRDVFDTVFDRMDRAVVHSSTFSQNNMAMAAGLATMKVLREEHLVEHAARIGEAIIEDMRAFVERHEFVKEVRGKGLMIALEFGEPETFKLKTAWKLLQKADESLFCQMILMPLFEKHRVLAQVAAHGTHVIKLLPPLVIDEADRDWMVEAFDQVIGECHRVPGSIWDLGTNLASHAMAR